MRSTLLVSLLVLAAVVTGGYCILWFAQAAQIKRSAEQIIAAINAQQQYVTYDAIETYGFPADINLAIVKPHFNGRVDMLLKSLAGAMPPPATPQAASQKESLESLPEWTEDLSLDGRIVFSINALSNHYRMAISGDMRDNSNIGGQATAMMLQPAGDAVCTLEMGYPWGVFGSLWNYQALVRDGAAFVKNFRMLDCINPGNAVSNDTTHEKLMGGGPARFYITSTPQGDSQQMRVYLKIVDSEITPQGDSALATYIHALSPDYPYPMNFSSYGKQNLEMDFTYNGTAEWKDDVKNLPLNIALSKFDITNQLYTGHATFYLANEMKDGHRGARLALQAQADVSEPYKNIMQDALRGFIHQLYASKDPHFAQLQTAIQQHTPEETYAVTAPALPDLHALGKLTEAVDASFQGAPDFSSGDASLAALELSATPYGITGSGSAKLTAGQPLPDGQVTLNCRNCLQLVDDVAAYIPRVQKAMDYFAPDKPATPIDPKVVEGVKAFLKALAAKDPANDNIFIYAMVSNPTSGITVSGRSLNDVMAMYNEYIGSLLKHNEDIKSQPSPAQ